MKLFEMAREPKTKKKADSLSRLLPQSAKEAKVHIKRFWAEFLVDDDDISIMDEYLSTKKITLKDGTKVGFLEWHAVLSVEVPEIEGSMTCILTTIDEPGSYRMDFVLPGQKKALVRSLREKLTIEIQKMEDKLTTTLPDGELEKFKRLKTSIKPMIHTHKAGRRQDDFLIARVLMDNIPLEDLHERGKQMRRIFDMVFKSVEALKTH